MEVDCQWRNTKNHYQSTNPSKRPAIGDREGQKTPRHFISEAWENKNFSIYKPEEKLEQLVE